MQRIGGDVKCVTLNDGLNVLRNGCTANTKARGTNSVRQAGSLDKSLREDGNTGDVQANDSAANENVLGKAEMLYAGCE